MKNLKPLDNLDFYHNLLIHVARTWERIRIAEGGELRIDNLGSLGPIVEITDRIFDTATIQLYLRTKDKTDWFYKNTGELSDTYQENKASELIYKNYNLTIRKYE